MSRRDVPMRSSLSKANLLLKGIPAEYLDCSLDMYNTDDETKNVIRKYIDNLHDMYEDRICLAFYGANGTGKTFLSSIIVKEAYRRRYASHMTTLAHYMELTFNKNKSEEQKEELKYIHEAEFLVIDELGKENFPSTQSNITLLEELLRQAVSKGQVIIVCTNLPLDDVGGVKGLYSLYGKSIRSLIEGEFLKIEFDDSDYRPNILKEKRGIKLLLGDD